MEPVVNETLVSNALAAEATLVIGSVEPRTGFRKIDLGLPFDSVSHPAYIARRMLNRTFMAPSPDGERFVVAYQFTGRLEVVTKDGVHLATALGPRPENPSYRMQAERFFWNDDNVSIYTGVTTSDRYIYLSYCGCRLDGEQDTRRVHVFHWNGRFVQEIAFSRSIGALTAAPDGSMLYSYAEEPYPMVVEWEPPRSLRPGT